MEASHVGRCTDTRLMRKVADCSLALAGRGPLLNSPEAIPSPQGRTTSASLRQREEVSDLLTEGRDKIVVQTTLLTGVGVPEEPDAPDRRPTRGPGPVPFRGRKTPLPKHVASRRIGPKEDRGTRLPKSHRSARTRPTRAKRRPLAGARTAAVGTTSSDHPWCWLSPHVGRPRRRGAFPGSAATRPGSTSDGAADSRLARRRPQRRRCFVPAQPVTGFAWMTSQICGGHVL